MGSEIVFYDPGRKMLNLSLVPYAKDYGTSFMF